jgi:hypothetical protein
MKVMARMKKDMPFIHLHPAHPPQEVCLGARTGA